MRVALLADVHANVHALRAVLADVARHPVDAVVVAGDLVGYGPAPGACLELLVGADARCVAGNHELRWVGRLAAERFSSLAERSLVATRGAIGSDGLALLADLPLTRSVGPMFVAHGSPGDAEEYVTRRARGRQLLGELATADPSARVLALGHTHRPWLVSELPAVRSVDEPPRRRLVNPGSVGQSRSRESVPLARYALVDATSARAMFRAVAYDVAGAEAELARLGLPTRCIHDPPARTRPIRAAGYRSLRRVGITPPTRKARV